MKIFNKNISAALLSACFALSFVHTAHAQLFIGQSAGFTGAVSEGVIETANGAMLYIDSVNARGGIHGQKIEILKLDDKFDPKIAAANAKTLTDDKRVLAMFLSRGTPQTEAMLPVLEKSGVAMVAPSTGAISLRSPVQRYVFNVRSPYQLEAQRVVTHFASVGFTRIAVVYADDSFGSDAVAGAQLGFAKTSYKPVVLEKFERSKPDFSSIAKKIAAANAQVVIMFASGKTAIDGIQAIKETKYKGLFVSLSNNASFSFAKAAGPGTVVTQVFPYERSQSSALVKEMTALAKEKGQDAAISPAYLEGYAGAKVMVEGLRRAGAHPTREKVRDALEAISSFDIGGFNVTYTPLDHTGLEFAELSVVGVNGKFLR